VLQPLPGSALHGVITRHLAFAKGAPLETPEKQVAANTTSRDLSTTIQPPYSSTKG
jgi:hypothetical protein